MRKTIATAALTLGALGLGAGAASADPLIDGNEHANTGDGVNVVISDILTNSLNGLLAGGVNIGDIDAL